MKNSHHYALLDEEREVALHPKAFTDTYEAIKNFSEKSDVINRNILKNDQNELSYIHNVLCSLPGHGKTTALEYHIKNELLQTDTKKRPFLLVFNNDDTMKSFYNEVKLFSGKWELINPILMVTEKTIEKVRTLLKDYQVVCITQQRLRDLALGYGDRDNFLEFQQEPLHWGRRSNNIKKTTVKRTIIIDEMPILVNSAVFDLGSDNNSVDWYDTIADNTDDKVLSPTEKKKGRLYISQLILNALHSVNPVTSKLINPFIGKEEEGDILKILSELNTKGIDSNTSSRLQWFRKLLEEDKVGVINKTNNKTNILCADKIDYSSFGNILILDGTANLTSTIYYHCGFEIIKVPNYHKYKERMNFLWRYINTSSNSRVDRSKNIREQINNDVIALREKYGEVFPIPAKTDKNYYIEHGAITPEQRTQFFADKVKSEDSLAINILNVTGKNDLSRFDNIALLSLPLLPPQEYKLIAIALYGTNIDLRLVKEIVDQNEQKLIKHQWFASHEIQRVFEEKQKAELSQIIHRSSIRNINSNQQVNIILYHNKLNVINLLKDIFELTDSSFYTYKLHLNNRFNDKCSDWAENVLLPLKDNPNVKKTAHKIGGSSFKKWIKDNWHEHGEEIKRTFRQHGITVSVSPKGYRYFEYIDDGIFSEV